MNSRSRADRLRRYAKQRKQKALNLEQLEARLMFAADTLEAGLHSVLQDSGSSEHDPLLFGNGFQSGGFGNTNQAPTIAVPLTLQGGNVVSSDSVIASLLGADDQPESELTYHWRVIESPDNVGVQFLRNGSNGAKVNTLTFTRDGEYEIRAGIVDRGDLKAAI